MNKILMIVLIFTGGFVHAQKVNPADYFTAEELKTAQTARDDHSLSEKEKQMITVMNLARLYPEKFARDYLPAVVKKAERIEVNETYKELVGVLLKQNPLAPLHPDGFLYKHARTHAKDMGKSGQSGHTSSGGKTFNMRMAPMQNRYKGVAENCQYGFKDAAEVIVDLLIDEGVPSRGHRKNILDPVFNRVGVSFESHKKFEVNCVHIFGAE